MKLIDVLREQCVIAHAAYPGKDEALADIARVAAASGPLENVTEQQILHGLNAREELGSTGFGKGIAIPHCRLDNVTDFVAGIITVPDGVDFDALDGEKVQIIVFIIAPHDQPNAQVKLLSAVSQALMVPGAYDELLAEKTPEALRESFLRHTRADLDAEEKPGKSLFHVFVQDEAVLRDVLQGIAGLEPDSMVVVDAQSPGKYLARLPLFADVWRDTPSSFRSLIIAVIGNGLRNEAIRRIESVTGHLDEQTGATVTVQELFYSAGRLEGQA